MQMEYTDQPKNCGREIIKFNYEVMKRIKIWETEKKFDRFGKKASRDKTNSWRRLKDTKASTNGNMSILT
jgi:hypothetical protein